MLLPLSPVLFLQCAHIPLFILTCVCFMAINCLSVNFSQPCSELWNYEQSEEPQKSSSIQDISTRSTEVKRDHSSSGAKMQNNHSSLLILIFCERQKMIFLIMFLFMSIGSTVVVLDPIVIHCVYNNSCNQFGVVN